MDNNEEWHLSKSVPITLIFAVAVQTAGFIWYMSSLDKSVETNAREIARQEVRLMASISRRYGYTTGQLC